MKICSRNLRREDVAEDKPERGAAEERQEARGREEFPTLVRALSLSDCLSVLWQTSGDWYSAVSSRGARDHVSATVRAQLVTHVAPSVQLCKFS